MKRREQNKRQKKSCRYIFELRNIYVSFQTRTICLKQVHYIKKKNRSSSETGVIPRSVTNDMLFCFLSIPNAGSDGRFNVANQSPFSLI